MLPTSCGDVHPFSVCSMPKRRAESADAGVHTGAKRRVVSAGAGFSLAGTGMGGGGAAAVAGNSGAVARGTTAAGRGGRCLGGSAVPAPAAVARARTGSGGGRLGQLRSRWRSLQLEQLRMAGVSTKSSL